MENKHHRKVFIIPASLFCLFSLVGCNNEEGTKGGLNTILVTYDAGDGYFNDGIVKTPTKVLEVRKGVRFSNLSNSERPKDSQVISNKADDDFVFSKSWKTNVKVGTTTQEKFINKDNDFIFNENVTLTACYENSKRNFETDSWDILIEKAEAGFNTLKEYYTTSYTNNGNTFVGLKKKLDYAGEDHIVRVIGEKIDEISNSDNKVACLTFEFVDVLPGYSFNVFEESNRYKDSSIHKALNNEVKNNIQSFNISHLQTVDKKTVKKTKVDTEASVEVTQDQVFVPSLSELNITTDPNGKKLEVDDEGEGDTYQYFTPNDGGVTEENKRRSKMYLPIGASEGIPYPYWTRSLDVSDTNYSSSWSIFTDGKCGYKDNTGNYESVNVTKAFGFAPCFCIGVTESEKVNISFETDSWDNVIATANQGYGALVTRYNKDYKKAKDKVDLKDGSTVVASVYRKPANSFVGLTRKLDILNDDNVYEEYTVRVIGENHDYTYDPQKSNVSDSDKKRTALTFQLTRDYNKETIWDDKANGYWSKDTYSGSLLQKLKGWHPKGTSVTFYYGDTAINYNLNGYSCGSKTVWSKPLINRIKFSDNITDASKAIKTVKKQTHQLSDHGSTVSSMAVGLDIRDNQFYWHKDATAKYVDQMLFPLNTFENGAEKYFVIREKIDNNKTIFLNNDFAIQGYAYEYYDYEKIYTPTNHVENILLPELNARRASDDLTGYAKAKGSYMRQAIPVKLTSDYDCEDILHTTVTWSTDGSYKGWEYGCYEPRYVRPAFCLGETLESTLRSGGYIA